MRQFDQMDLTINNALILNSGSSWAAYQIGALRKLVEEDQLHFDLCAGTGIGAMNAAFIACGEWEALKMFWEGIKKRKLLSINWKSPMKKGLFIGTPQQKFIDKYISEDKLVERGVVLAISCLNMTTGNEEILIYPGETRLNLNEAIMAAVSVPGMSKYGTIERDVVVEGTFVRSFILHRIFRDFAPKQMFAVAAYAAGKNKVFKPGKYTTWIRQLKRTFQLNLCRDVDNEIEKTERDIKAMQVYKKNMERIDELIKIHARDEELQKSLQKVLVGHLENSSFTHRSKEIPSLIKIISEKEIEFPLWSFKRKKLASLQNAGYSDACKAVESFKNYQSGKMDDNTIRSSNYLE